MPFLIITYHPIDPLDFSPSKSFSFHFFSNPLEEFYAFSTLIDRGLSIGKNYF